MPGLQNLSGKVAVVTGGASGIGKGTATQLVRAGMHVVIADIEAAALTRTADEIGAIPVPTDVASAASVTQLAEAVQRRFGTVHVVCNNAGVGSVAPIRDMKLPDWHWLIGVNLWGVIHGVTTFLPILKANADGGHIVNTASMGGLAAMANLGGYAVTKYGVVALTETLAIEFEAEHSKVGVTVLCPGTVRTNIGASKRNRPTQLSEGGLVDVDIQQTEFGARMRWLEPEAVGAIVVNAIRRGDLYAFTHPDMKAGVLERHQRIAAALAQAEAALES